MLRLAAQRLIGRFDAVVLVALLTAAVAAAVAAAAVSWKRGGEGLPITGTTAAAEIVGYVSGVDNEGNVLVARGMLDFRPRAIKIGPHTTIQVGGKEGGIGDVRQGAYVAVTYATHNDGLVAERIGVYETLSALHADAAGRRLARRDPPASGDPSATPADRVPPPIVSTQSEDTEIGRPHRATARRNPRSPERMESSAASSSADSASTHGTKSSAAGQGGDPEDPAAVIDWLLKRSRRN